MTSEGTIVRGGGSLGPGETLREFAERLVSPELGLAPDVAVGWARRCENGWQSEAASASRSGCLSPIFDLASLTKPMLALSLARSTALHRFCPIGDALEEARGTLTESVPIELLLAHRAGLAAHVPLYDVLMYHATSSGVTFEAAERSRALRRAAEARRPAVAGVMPPDGAPPVYSDLGYILAGEALCRSERARDPGEVMEHYVAQPLARDDLGTARRLSSALGDEFSIRVRPTEWVDWRGGQVRGVVHDENAWALTNHGGSGHAGMFGSVEAVLAFATHALDAIERRQGPLVAGDASWLIRPRPGGTLAAGFDRKSPEGSSAGERSGTRTVGHLGFTGTSVWMDPDADIVTVFLSNRVCPTRTNTTIRQWRPLVHDALFDRAARSAQGGS